MKNVPCVYCSTRDACGCAGHCLVPDVGGCCDGAPVEVPTTPEWRKAVEDRTQRLCPVKDGWEFQKLERETDTA